MLLDGPRRDEQIEGLNQLLRNMGELGIGVMGYNFSYANVWGTIRVAEARGGAPSPGYCTDLAPPQAEIPNGMVWNTVYDDTAPAGTIGTVEEALKAAFAEPLTAIEWHEDDELDLPKDEAEEERDGVTTH